MDHPHTITLDSFVKSFLSPVDEYEEAPADGPSGSRAPLAPQQSFQQQLKTVPLQPTEAAMHAAFVKAVNTSGVAPELFVTTSRTECINVGGLYPAHHALQSRPAMYDNLQATFHCFKKGGDPFSSDEPTGLAAENKEEIIAHTARVFARQQRMFLLTIILVGDQLRLARITRTVVVVTAPVTYSEEQHANTLADVFRRFAQLSPVQRGHDITATLVAANSTTRNTMVAASHKQLKGAADFARRCFRDSLDPTWPWWKLAVYQPGSHVQHFLVGKPHFFHANLDDRRGAKGYVALALDEPGQPFVFLKDTWRWQQEWLGTEGTRLAALNAQGVRHVPTLVCHGDVPGQRFDLMKFLEGPVYGRPLGTPEKPLVTVVYVHYRMVVREVGKPLRHFKNGRELVKVFKDCVEAHRDAFVHANLLHRDISPGNMLMVPVNSKHGGTTHEGMLMDWEMSECVEPGADRSTNRRGTYQYLSVKAMDDAKSPHVVADELEAFLHVLIKLCIRFIPNDCADPRAFHAAYFDTEEAGTGQREECSSLKRRCVEEGILLTEEGQAVSFTMPEKAKMRRGGERAMRVPSEHPVDGVVQPLLQCAMARFWRLEKERNGSGPDTVKKGEGVTETHSSDASKENEDRAVPQSPRKKIPSSPVPPSPRARVPLGNANTNAAPCSGDDSDVTNYDRLSTALDTHAPFLGFLSAALKRKDWPSRDKTRDQVRSLTAEEADGTYISRYESGSSDGNDGSESGSLVSESDAGGVSKAGGEEKAQEVALRPATRSPAPAGTRVVKRARSDDSLEDYVTSSDSNVSAVKPAGARPVKRARSDDSLEDYVTSSDSGVPAVKHMRIY